MIKTETETVIKRILPYLERRGYNLIRDLDFETAIKTTDRYKKGYIDILVTMGKKKARFLIEAKKISKKLTIKDRDQAIEYASSSDVNVPFVVVTNGNDIQCFNTKNKKRILWDGKLTDKIPNITQLPKVLRILRANPIESNISITDDNSLPFRPGLPLRQLNALFSKGHNTIRKVEKNEEFAFADFSKLLFLKLLEEKSDTEEDFKIPYSYRFYELAEYRKDNADQVMAAIQTMIDIIIEKTPYGEVLQDKIHLKNPNTYMKLVKDLASVSFYDCSVDSKGAAFEYYVRATLKGKKLGQYFTPRELIKVMMTLVGQHKIVNSIVSGTKIKVLDPACGTGGFLVYLMQDSINKLTEMYKNRKITSETYNNLIKKVKEEVFYGSDANEGVAAASKMNMIISGDGHTNIQHEDSLFKNTKNWSVDSPDCNIILTNPPFGTSESDSLTHTDLMQYDVAGTKGQYLFLQKMIKTTIPGGEICTVIDEGLLNTDTGFELRKYILQNCVIRAIVKLPDVTFKPNKINVKASILYLEKRTNCDTDLEESYSVTVCNITSLGYYGSGAAIRGFDYDVFYKEVEKDILDQSGEKHRFGYNWESYDVNVKKICEDRTHRFDYKYWKADTKNEIEKIVKSNGIRIKELNTIETRRGKSPQADNYVDESEGYALVIKAGSSIDKFGNLILENSDWIEKTVYDEFVQKAVDSSSNYNLIEKGDVLISSTGEGTLGKACVYDCDFPAIADGHVTIIRVDKTKISNYYLVDYLRNGFGATQINRFYTGSTGLIELTPEHVNEIVVVMTSSVKQQNELSKQVRNLEQKYHMKLAEAEKLLDSSKSVLNE